MVGVKGWVVKDIFIRWGRWIGVVRRVGVYFIGEWRGKDIGFVGYVRVFIGFIGGFISRGYKYKGREK